MSNLTAKEMYMENNCNHFYIMHDGLWDEYINIGGNNLRLERIWRKEYINFWFDNIQKDEFTAFYKLEDVRAKEIIDDLLRYNLLRDDYAKFWYAKMLWRLSKRIFNPWKRVKVKKKAKAILNQFLTSEIVILDENKERITKEMLYNLEASNEEEYIKNYSEKILSGNA